MLKTLIPFTLLQEAFPIPSLKAISVTGILYFTLNLEDTTPITPGCHFSELKNIHLEFLIPIFAIS